MKGSKFYKNQITSTEVYINPDKPITVPVCKCIKGVVPWLPSFDGYTWIKRLGKHQKGYLNLYAGFDIETTNLITEERKVAYMYIWQLSICSDLEGIVYLGRTWEDFIYLLENISEYYNLDNQHRLIIWDANFSFEHQFIRKRLTWQRDSEYDFFAKELRKPLLATTLNIEFRECLSISGGSLAQLAADYTTTQKLKGDLDYKVLRNYKSRLTLQELNYCINDVVILSEWSKHIFNTYIGPSKLVPVTKTGLLRIEVKAAYKRMVSNNNEYKALMAHAFPDESTYIKWFRYLFRGGFVHANLPNANRVLEALMEDITSSYPARMLLSYYPVTPFKDEPFSAEALRTKCCIMEVEFYGLHSKYSHSIESLHKAIDYEGVKIDNGRIYHAERLRVMLTELDLENYTHFYKWKKARVISFKTAKRGKLPAFILEVLKKHYIEKAKLKKAKLNHTAKYAITKALVNSAFGLMVTRIQLDKVDYINDQWTYSEVSLDYESERKRQILLPQWGIYVAAHARRELLTIVYRLTKECGNIVIYCDTDSIKYRPHPKAEAIFKEYNEEIAKQLVAAGLTDPAFNDLGMFDFEGHATRFKTLGAKRYLAEVDGKVEATIAGLPKGVINKFTDPFEVFNAEGWYIESENSDKLTTSYNDNYHGDYILGEWVEEESSVALYEVPFSIHTDRDYYNMLIQSQERRKIIGTRDGG